MSVVGRSHILILIAIRESAKSLHHMSQTAVILKSTRKLLHNVNSQLKTIATASRLRFLAHLVIVLRVIGADLDDKDGDAILTAYITNLDLASPDIISLYCSRLSSGATDRFAIYLDQLPLSLQKDDRLHAVSQAQQHGLDIDNIAATTVEIAVRRMSETVPSTPFVSSLLQPLTPYELKIVRSVEWLQLATPASISLSRTTSTGLMRFYLCAFSFAWPFTDTEPQLAKGQSQVARALLSAVLDEIDPLNIVDTSSGEAQEFSSYEELLSILTSFGQWQEICSLRPHDTAPQLEHMQYKSTLAATCGRNMDSVMKLLTGDWLQDIDGADEQRESEIAAVRRLWIPELIMNTHRLLVASDEARQAIELATTVADEEFRLYQEFIPLDQLHGVNTLPLYLEEVRKALLKHGEGKSSPWDDL